jgi:hypothetical protein
VPEPFLRLGLVRFQKNARRQLQVSEPITEWIQILPKRTVCVSEEPGAPRVAGQCRRRRVLVSVESPADYGVTSWDEACACAADRPSGAPFIRASIMRIETKLNGSIHQSIIMPEGHISDSCTRMPPKPSSAGTLWDATIEFFDEPATSGGTCRYAVFVEEVESLLPATFPTEPAPRNKTDGSIETGPRFAAWIDIGDAPVEPKHEVKVLPSPPRHKPKPNLTKRKPSTRRVS